MDGAEADARGNFTREPCRHCSRAVLYDGCQYVQEAIHVVLGCVQVRRDPQRASPDTGDHTAIDELACYRARRFTRKLDTEHVRAALIGARGREAEGSDAPCDLIGKGSKARRVA